MGCVTRSPLELARLVVARPPQPRGDGARLDVYDDEGALGAFVEATPEELKNASVVRLDDADGNEVLSVLHPGRVTRARVDIGGTAVGFVSRVGRVRANLELHGPGRKPEGDPIAVLRPLDGGDGWSGMGATLRWWQMGEPTVTSYGEARYTLDLEGGVDAALRPMLLAAVVLVDRAVIQAVIRPA
jgi:hypothetical protein